MNISKNDMTKIEPIIFRISDKELKKISEFITKQNNQLISFINNKESKKK